MDLQPNPGGEVGSQLVEIGLAPGGKGQPVAGAGSFETDPAVEAGCQQPGQGPAIVDIALLEAGVNELGPPRFGEIDALDVLDVP